MTFYTQIFGIADNVGKTPQQWNGSIFSMIQGLSDHVVVPIAGAILAVIATLELIQLIIDKNNFHDFDTFIIFKWVFKTAASVLIVSNTWNIVMGIFEAAQSVVSRASGLVMSGAQLSIESAITGIEARLADMELGALFGLWFQTMLIGFTMWALVICIFVITFGRMIEIYLVTSIAPIPMATMVSREWGQTGQNYLRTLFALGFQAFIVDYRLSCAWRFMPFWCRISPSPRMYPSPSLPVWDIPCFSASRCSRPAACPAACSAHIKRRN